MIRHFKVLLVLPIAACFLQSQPAEQYRVAGVVINSESGSPMPHARVAVLRYGATQIVASQVTAGGGKFSFDLPAGKFRLEAGTRDLRQSYGSRKPDARTGTSVITGPEQNTSNLTFRWFPPGAITGRVTDQDGEPVESALVQLIRSVIVLGRRTTSSAGFTRTDDRGEYRFGPLSGGTYLLAVTGTPWYSRPGLDTAESALAFAPLYYPNTADVSKAAPLLLKPGQEARADFTLSTVSGATVSVKQDGRAIEGSIALITNGIGGSDEFQRSQSFSGERVVQFLRIPPGRYLVRLTGSKGASNYSGRKFVDVNGSDASVDLELKPAPAVSGTVQLKNPKAKPRGTLLISLVREDTTGTFTTAVHPDGSFTFPIVPVMKCRVAIRGTDGFFASDVQSEGTRFEGGVLDLQEAETVTLRLTASDAIGRLQGFVMQGDKPIEGVMAALAPAHEGGDRLQYRGFQTDSDGSFDFQNVPEGDYLLFAVDDTDIEYASPTAVRPYLANAKPIRIEAHGKLSERIPLSPTIR